MRRFLIVSLLLTVTFLIECDWSAAGTPQEAFQRLLSLEGTWNGEWKGEKQSYPMRLTFRAISEKAALMETLESLADGTSMVTIYHIDGNQLMATHYCRFNNQPRMTAQIPEGAINKLEFHFLDGRNLVSSYASDILFEFLDDNTIVQAYKFKGHDVVATVKYLRAKE